MAKKKRLRKIGNYGSIDNREQIRIMNDIIYGKPSFLDRLKVFWDTLRNK